MNDERATISSASQTFLREAPKQVQALGRVVHDLAQASSLDAKTGELAYLPVLAALGLTSRAIYHVQAAKGLGV